MSLYNEHTVAYSVTAQGWPSFYSYEPDFMIGMANYFYSFSGANLWRHNSDAVNRNNFYGTDYDSSIQGVFNQAPLENKLFKTLNLESDGAWSATLSTDVNPNGSTQTIDASWFVQKEGDWFAYLRYTDVAAPDPFSLEYPLRSVNGIGRTDFAITGAAAASLVTFPVGIEINSILSIGDKFYFVENPVDPSVGSNNLTLMGTVIGIDRSVRAVLVDASCGACTVPVLVPGGTDGFFAYMKNMIAESYGALGHYMVFTLTNSSTTATELFAVESEVMKSYP